MPNVSTGQITNTVQNAMKHTEVNRVTFCTDTHILKFIRTKEITSCRRAGATGIPHGGHARVVDHVGGVRVCFDPLKCHILSFKTVVG